MSKQVKIRRGTSVEHNAFTGALGEVTMDVTAKTLRVHDGVTPGGVALARGDAVTDMSGADYVVQFQAPSAANGYTWYRKYKSGWVEQGGMWTGQESCDKGQEIMLYVILPIKMANTDYFAQASVMDRFLFQIGAVLYDNTAHFRFGAYEDTRSLKKFLWHACGISE